MRLVSESYPGHFIEQVDAEAHPDHSVDEDPGECSAPLPFPMIVDKENKKVWSHEASAAFRWIKPPARVALPVSNA